MKVLVVLVLVGGLPLFGVAWLGKPVAPYLEFPPQPRSVEHAPFSWPMFVGITILVVLTLAPMMVEALRAIGLDTPVIIGGIVPDDDVEPLLRGGVAAVLGPGASAVEVADTVRRAVAGSGA